MSDGRRDEALAAAYLRVFDPGFPEGKLVFDDIMLNAGLLDPGSPDDSATALAFRAGQRSIATMILNRMSWSPGELALLRRRMNVEALHGFGEIAAHPPSGMEPI